MLTLYYVVLTLGRPVAPLGAKGLLIMPRSTETYEELVTRYTEVMGFPPRDSCADRSTLKGHMAQREKAYKILPPGTKVGPMGLPASYCREQLTRGFSNRKSSSKLKDPRNTRKM
jgi:hypothetical protein